MYSHFLGQHCILPYSFANIFSTLGKGGLVYSLQFVYVLQKLANSKWKPQPKQLLGCLLLAIIPRGSPSHGALSRGEDCYLIGLV